MQYPTANITYGGLEDKGLTVKVKDTSDPKTKWIVWKTDRENPEMQNEVYAALQNYKLGETFGVTYGEKERSFTGKEGNTITYKERTIYSIMPVVANPTSQPTQTPAQGKSPHTEANNASGGKSDEFWEQQAYEKCCSLWAAAEIQNGVQFNDLITNGIEKGYYWNLFQAIKADGEKRFSVLEPKATEPTGEDPFYVDVPF